MNLKRIFAILATSTLVIQARIPGKKPPEARQLEPAVCPLISQSECGEAVPASNPDQGKSWVVSNAGKASNAGGEGLSGPKCAQLHPNCATCTPGFKSCKICHDYSDDVGFEYQADDGVCVVPIDFDDLDSGNSPYHFFVPNGYRGLNWDNFYFHDALLSVPGVPGSGFVLGTVSQPNSGFNGGARPASILSADPLTIVGLQATSGWWMHATMTILFEGFNSNGLVATHVVEVVNDGPTYIDLAGFKGLTEFKLTTSYPEQAAIDDILVLYEI